MTAPRVLVERLHVLERLRLQPQPTCGQRVSWDKVAFRCDRPADHLPATDHSVTLRWTTKP